MWADSQKERSTAPIRTAKQLAFANNLQKLQQRDIFQRVDFEHALGAVRAHMSPPAWQLVVVRGSGGRGD